MGRYRVLNQEDCVLTCYLTCKILFGPTGLRSEDFFRITVSRNILNLRGPPYQLIHDVAKKSVSNTFFVNRIVGIWNNLHLVACVFSCFNQFKQYLTRSSVKLSLIGLILLCESLHASLFYYVLFIAILVLICFY